MKLFIHITKFTLTILAILAIISSLIWGWQALDLNKEFIITWSSILVCTMSIPLVSILTLNAFTLEFDSHKELITITIASYVFSIPIGQVLQHFIMDGVHIKPENGATFNHIQQILADWVVYGFLTILIIDMVIVIILILAIAGYLIYEVIVALWNRYE